MGGPLHRHGPHGPHLPRRHRPLWHGSAHAADAVRTLQRPGRRLQSRDLPLLRGLSVRRLHHPRFRPHCLQRHGPQRPRRPAHHAHRRSPGPGLRRAWRTTVRQPLLPRRRGRGTGLLPRGAGAIRRPRRAHRLSPHRTAPLHLSGRRTRPPRRRPRLQHLPPPRQERLDLRPRGGRQHRRRLPADHRMGAHPPRAFRAPFRPPVGRIRLREGTAPLLQWLLPPLR